MKVTSPIYNTIRTIVSSKKFLWVIIGLFVFQSLWIAFSFRFPMLYDEAFHVDATVLYAEQVSPIITGQPEKYDVYGSLSHGGATIFHYILSFPYRLVHLFTDNLAVLVISLRVICIALFAFGIYLYNRLLKQIGINQGMINIGMLIFVLLPIVPFVAATVNYDNMLFPLTALFLILAVQIALKKPVNALVILGLIVVGCLASLVKSTFLVVFAFTVVYLGVLLVHRNGKKVGRRLISSMRSSQKSKLIIMGIAALVTVGLFSTVFLQNIVRYGSLQPACEKVLSSERCALNSGAIRDQNAIATKDTRPLMPLPNYASDWAVQMANWTNMTGARTAGSGTVVSQPLPVIFIAVFFGGMLAVGCLLYSWRAIRKNSAWRYIILVCVVLVLAVFAQNLFTYTKLHVAYAIQPRYLLTVLPIIITMSVVAAAYILKRRRNLQLFVFIGSLAVMSQGGGLTTHIILSEDNWYWNNSTVRQVNQTARNIIDPLVKSSISQGEK